VTQDAVLLAGSLGLGHEMMARSCAGLLEQSGWRTRRLDSMSLLGPVGGDAGMRLFDRLVTIPGLYDGLHFAHLRTGSRLADLMDRAASSRLVPALRAELERRPADLVFSVFATGASAAARLKQRMPGLRTVVLCTDVTVHRMWVREGTDLFLVTSPAAAASVRRYLPRARVSVVPPPVRSAFYAAPPREQARAALGVPPADFCVLVIDSGWGFGPLVEGVAALAEAGVHVLAVAGRDRAIERRLRELAATTPRVTAFGFTDRVPELMAAADVVLALPGATTCSEARVVGRELLLLDVMPGHGRDNLLHELEQGGAHVCVPTPAGVTASVLALRDAPAATWSAGPAGPARGTQRAQRWEPAYVAALQAVGVDLRLPAPPQPAEADLIAPSPGLGPAALPLATPGKESVPMMRTLFLNPPSYEGFDGGAGARYQARREIRSYWYPNWLAQPAAMVPGSRLVDAPPAGLSIADIAPLAGRLDLAIVHTSSPTFAGDIKVAEALKAENPALQVGFVGAKVAVEPERSLLASPAIDFVGREEFDFTIADVAEGRPLASVDGVSYRGPDGQVVHNKDRTILEDMDRLPFVTPVYKRDLRAEDYSIGYLRHPYMSIYTGRGCRSRCTFCLWPQTVGGHRYRTRSVANVLAEAELVTQLFPQVKELFFDDDTFTDDRPRAEAIARGLARLGITWSCNAKANVPRETLAVLKDNGLRLVVVGYESGSQQILNNVKKGLRVDRARRFARDCKDLGITVHGTFILGLPGETRETIQETIRYAREVNPHTIQVSVAAPYPGTELHRKATESGWIPQDDDGATLVSEGGTQLATLSYPHLERTEILESVDAFYKRFYFRAGKLAEMSAELLRRPDMAARRLREGGEFVRFLSRRARTPAAH
jgi:hopanoid biosynthesis associated radical SAM protein HpnJ